MTDSLLDADNIHVLVKSLNILYRHRRGNEQLAILAD